MAANSEWRLRQIIRVIRPSYTAAGMTRDPCIQQCTATLLALVTIPPYWIRSLDLEMKTRQNLLQITMVMQGNAYRSRVLKGRFFEGHLKQIWIPGSPVIPLIPFRLANRPGMAGIVPELTHGVPCPGRSRLLLSRKCENWPPDMDIWLFTNECIVFCIVFVSHTWLDLSVMSLTNEIVIIRLATNTINNDEMQRA